MGKRSMIAILSSLVLLVPLLWAASAVVKAQERGRGAPGRRPDFRRPNLPLIQAIDANGDGEIATEEIEKAPSALKKLDKDGNGKLTAEEYRGRVRFGPGSPGRGPGPTRRRAGRRPRSGTITFQKDPLPKDDKEKKILSVLEQMKEGPRFANVPTSDGRLLRLLTEAVGAKRVVEIGTSTGVSAMWLALGLKETGGKLITHEIDARRANIARKNLEKADVDHLITVVQGDAHETVKRHKEPIDVLFLDADKQGYIDYLNKLLPLVRPGGLVIAHNMNPRQADPDYVEAITTDPKLETLFLHMDRTGVGVTLKKR